MFDISSLFSDIPWERSLLFYVTSKYCWLCDECLHWPTFCEILRYYEIHGVICNAIHQRQWIACHGNATEEVAIGTIHTEANQTKVVRVPTKWSIFAAVDKTGLQHSYLWYYVYRIWNWVLWCTGIHCHGFTYMHLWGFASICCFKT